MDYRCECVFVCDINSILVILVFLLVSEIQRGLAMRKRICVQKKATRRQKEKTDIGVPQKTNRKELKKKMETSAELIKAIEALLKDAAAKIKKAELPTQPFQYRPRVPNCEGYMIDL